MLRGSKIAIQVSDRLEDVRQSHDTRHPAMLNAKRRLMVSGGRLNRPLAKTARRRRPRCQPATWTSAGIALWIVPDRTHRQPQHDASPHTDLAIELDTSVVPLRDVMAYPQAEASALAR